ncbi:hypothetical protein ACJ2BB_00045, partial [Klebsiella pneumoniae]
NILVMDEPTNHLDMESIESQNKAREMYQGTLIFFYHDPEFFTSLATPGLFHNSVLLITPPVALIVGGVRRQPPPANNAALCLIASPGGAALTGPARCEPVRGPGRPGKA